MLRHALRRLLWTLPTLIGVSVVTFLFLSYVPDPTDDPLLANQLSVVGIDALRRERFMGLPRFLNPSPDDVRTRAARAMDAIVASGPGADEGRRELARLGGAALPYVLPRLDTLATEPRTQIARALAPIAARMGIAAGDDLDRPDRAMAFWSRYWDDRGPEFRAAAVRSAVSRLMRHGSASRAPDLIELDTFALDDVLAALEPPADGAEFRKAQALVDVAAHVTGRNDRIAGDDDLEAAQACVERWRAYWYVYRGDFVVFSGASRVSAMLLETRYGKWALGAVTNRLGRLDDGTTVLDELALRAPVTLCILFGAIALAYAAAVPLGALAAAYRGRRPDLAISAFALGLYAIPTAASAVAVSRAFHVDAGRLVAATLTLALALVAAPMSQQRSALAAALSGDHVRAAVARGASRTRAMLVHGLRNALLPVVTLAALEAPMALGGAFVVERVFNLRGVGEATILAVQHREIVWLMAISIVAASLAAAFVFITDLAYTLIDPRLVQAIRGRGARA